MSDIILLDTHIWYWLILGDEKLKSSKILSLIEQGARASNIKVSAISVWEIGMLEAKGKIRLTTSCLAWAEQALSAPGVSLEPLSVEVAIESSRLPGNFHGDPADRILVATARHLGATLITQDTKILEYGKINYVRAKKAF